MLGLMVRYPYGSRSGTPRGGGIPMSGKLLADDASRRIATIDGQLKGIERLVDKQDVSQVLTQLTAVRNALCSLVKVILHASTTERFGMAMLTERPEDVFDRALERAMRYWCTSRTEETTVVAQPDETDFRTNSRVRIRAVQDRLRGLDVALQSSNYLMALRELGSVRCSIEKLVRLALRNFIGSRVADKKQSKRVRDQFEHAVDQALKYWHLPDPQVLTPPSAEAETKILVVDDDPDVVDYLRHVLEKQDFSVATAGNAGEAMDKVESEKPDLIVLDVMMPQGIEGFHFAWDLRARPEPEYRSIPIIVLSSIHDTTSMRFYPDQSDGVYGPGEYLPVEDFIDKPVEEQRLLRAVERALRIGRRNMDGS